MADMLEDDGSDGQEHQFGHQEWDKLEENFINAGYREGITAGKEEALQEGFDAGFAQFGAPIGREIGTLRGMASAVLVFLDGDGKDDGDDKTPSQDTQGESADTGAKRESRATMRIEVGNMIRALAKIRLASLLPPDTEAIEHAREHVGADQAGIDDLLGQGTTGAATDTEREEKVREVEDIKTRLRSILQTLGLDVEL